jgi:hypothetical protein
MSEILTKVVVNCETGEQEIIPLTPEEIEQLEARQVAWEAEKAAREAEAQAKAEAKASGIAKLIALGLTEEEAQALVK